MFAPTSLTIKAGSTVTWTNGDDEPHTVVSDSGLFRFGALDTNHLSLCVGHSFAHGWNGDRSALTLTDRPTPVSTALVRSAARS